MDPFEEVCPLEIHPILVQTYDQYGHYDQNMNEAYFVTIKGTVTEEYAEEEEEELAPGRINILTDEHNLVRT